MTPLIRTIPDDPDPLLPMQCERCNDDGTGPNDEGEWLCDDCMAHWFAKDFDPQKWGDV